MSPQTAVQGAWVRSEAAEPRGWLYDVVIEWEHGGETRHTATLSWADHDQLCGGANAPSDAARAVAVVAARGLGRLGLPHRFDAATMRRRIPGFDAAVRAELGIGPVG